jgi:predicted ribosomally synthesized peptide with nif11-like leader
MSVSEPSPETKGGIMSINNARDFVEKMKQDQNFRKKVLATTGPEDLLLFLQENDLPFNQRELVKAMAECMEQLELRMGG